MRFRPASSHYPAAGSANGRSAGKMKKAGVALQGLVGSKAEVDPSPIPSSPAVHSSGLKDEQPGLVESVHGWELGNP